MTLSFTYIKIAILKLHWPGRRNLSLLCTSAQYSGVFNFYFLKYANTIFQLSGRLSLTKKNILRNIKKCGCGWRNQLRWNRIGTDWKRTVPGIVQSGLCLWAWGVIEYKKNSHTIFSCLILFSFWPRQRVCLNWGVEWWVYQKMLRKIGGGLYKRSLCEIFNLELFWLCVPVDFFIIYITQYAHMHTK